MFKTAAGLASLAFVASLSLATAPRDARAASTAGSSLYTAAQATAGKKLYIANCAQCHAADLSGVSAPPLKGAVGPFHGTQSVAEAYDYISGQMPMSNPGGLPSATYVSILAYLIQQNGHAPGTTALTLAIAKKNPTKI
jgi:mono/diheme cytochrome c family protein